MSEHEVVIVGGGHNGLVCAAYLARAGVDVCLLEARDTVGGCASTVDALDGARVNICNCDHAMVRASGIVEELGLADFGLRYLELEPTHLALSWTGEVPWLLCHDPERTVATIAHGHPGEVAGYRRYLEDMLPAARLVAELTQSSPAPGAVTRTLARRRGRGLARVLSLARRSVGDVLRSYFSSEALRGDAVTTGPAVWGLSADTPGTGLGALAYAMRHVVPTGRPVGGSGALSDAVAAAAVAAGATVRTGAQVERILCRGERAAGVRLIDGDAVFADEVVIACDPHAAMLEWLQDPPSSACAMLDRWRAKPTVAGYESKLDAVVEAPPRYRQVTPELRAAAGLSDGDEVRPTAIVSPSLAAIAAAHAGMGRGEVAAQPLLFAQVPSALDDTMRPAGGGHVFSLETLYTPYALKGGWSGSREPERWLEAFGALVEPGFLDGVRRFRAVTPVEYETDFHMPRGHAASFTGGPLAAVLGRDRELTRYRTAVGGLWLTGAATFPGAGVWGASGRNAARALIDHTRT